MNIPSSGEQAGGNTAGPANDPGNLLNMLIQAAERGNMWSSGRTGGGSFFEEALLEKLQTLTEQLAPLRELQPHLEPLPDTVVAQLKSLRDALARPDWSNATRLEPQQPPRRTAFATGAGGAQQTAP